MALKDFVLGNYRTSIKETEDDTDKWKDTSRSRTGRICLKRLYTTKGTLQVNSTLIKILMVFSTELQLIIKLVWENTHKPHTDKMVFFMENTHALNSQKSWGKRRKLGPHAPWFKPYNNAIVIVNRIVPAQKQTHRWSMEQNTEPRNKPTLTVS